MSYIKFCANRLAHWVAEGTVTVTDYATGYGKEYMLDTRKMTYWKSDGYSGDKYISIDTGADNSFDALYLYYYGGGSSHSVGIYADSNSDYSTEIQMGGESPLVGTWTMKRIGINYATAYRYWRIKINNLSAAVKVSQLYLGPEYEISVNFNYGDEDGVDYGNVSIFESKDGTRSADGGEPRNYKKIDWDLLDETNKEKLAAIFALTKGARYPLFFIDEDSDIHFSRIMNAKLGAIQTYDAIYKIPTLLIEDEVGTPV